MAVIDLFVPLSSLWRLPGKNECTICSDIFFIHVPSTVDNIHNISTCLQQFNLQL